MAKTYLQPKLVSGTNIKTINGSSLLGSGNITISQGSTQVIFGYKYDGDFWDKPNGDPSAVVYTPDASKLYIDKSSEAIYRYDDVNYVYAEVSPDTTPTTFKAGAGINSEVFNGCTPSYTTGQYSHAEGNGSYATGNYSHAEGYSAAVSGYYSHAEGRNTIASGSNQHVEGKYNIADVNNLHILGNGTSSARSNAHTIDASGNAWFSGDVYVGSASGTNKDAGSVKLVADTQYTLFQDFVGTGDTSRYGPWYLPTDKDYKHILIFVYSSNPATSNQTGGIRINYGDNGWIHDYGFPATKTRKFGYYVQADIEHGLSTCKFTSAVDAYNNYLSQPVYQWTPNATKLLTEFDTRYRYMDISFGTSLPDGAICKIYIA